MDNMSGACDAEMQLISEYKKDVIILECVIHV